MRNQPSLEGLERFSNGRVEVIAGAGALAEIGSLARELGLRRPLLVADDGLLAAGHAGRAFRLLEAAGIEAAFFHDFSENPDTRMVERGRLAAEAHRADSFIALGGGSSLDCAKGINFVLTNGGTMKDYWGHGKASQPLLPMIGIPTTTGTGSEAQSYALISDAETHVKMACGNHDAYFRIALLDPELALTQPLSVLGPAGYDALSHAVESYVSTKRTEHSQSLSRRAWELLETSFERVLAEPDDLEAMSRMQFGAFLAGDAIEHSMLGATHACANPLTQRYGTIHGVAIALLLSHVVAWNEPVAGASYPELHPDLATRLGELARAANLRTRLSEQGIPHKDLGQLAEAAAHQWTGRFNPRPFDAKGAREIYDRAW